MLIRRGLRSESIKCGSRIKEKNTPKHFWYWSVISRLIRRSSMLEYGE